MTYGIFPPKILRAIQGLVHQLRCFLLCLINWRADTIIKTQAQTAMSSSSGSTILLGIIWREKSLWVLTYHVKMKDVYVKDLYVSLLYVLTYRVNRPLESFGKLKLKWMSIIIHNRIGGVMVSVLASSAVDRWIQRLYYPRTVVSVS